MTNRAIAILEDNDDRIAAMDACLSRSFPTLECRFFRTAPEFIAWLPKGISQARLISLDHDLEPAPDQGIDFDPGTGRDVSRTLLDFPSHCPVLIHSTNVHAAIAMEAELNAQGWSAERITPYGDLDWIMEAWLPAVHRLIVDAE